MSRTLKTKGPLEPREAGGRVVPSKNGCYTGATQARAQMFSGTRNQHLWQIWGWKLVMLEEAKIMKTLKRMATWGWRDKAEDVLYR